MSSEFGSAIASAVGGVSSSLHQAYFNRKEATTNRRYQRNMSNSAYQRQMRDLRDAGLNPMLVSQLGGASTPSGSQASISNIENPGASAVQAYRQAKEAKYIEQNTATAKAQEILTQENSRIASANAYIAEVKAKRLGKEVNAIDNRASDNTTGITNALPQSVAQWVRFLTGSSHSSAEQFHKNASPNMLRKGKNAQKYYEAPLKKDDYDKAKKKTKAKKKGKSKSKKGYDYWNKPIKRGY